MSKCICVSNTGDTFVPCSKNNQCHCSNYEFIGNEIAAQPKFLLQKRLSQVHWNKFNDKITHRCQLPIWNIFGGDALRPNLVLSKSTFSNTTTFKVDTLSVLLPERASSDASGKLGYVQSSVYFTWSLSNWIFVFNSETPNIWKVKGLRN
jgi:hypothetical protein